MIKKALKKALCIVCTLTMVATLAACGGSGNTPSSTTDGTGAGASTSTAAGGTAKDTLAVGILNEPPTLDPIKIDDPASYMVMASIYEGLMKQTPDLEVVPCLAESYDVVDTLTYRFHLKKGVKFHNGEEMKASDVVFSLKRLAEEPLKKSFSDPLDPDGIVAEDDYTVIVKTKYPYAPILSALATTTFAIVSEKAVTEMGDDAFGRSPVGTSPWKFTKWTAGTDIALERFEDYHDAATKAKCKSLTFRIIVEAANRVVELETGGVDIIQNVPTSSLNSLEGNSDITLYSKNGLQLYAVEFDQIHTPMENKLVRQALMFATDVQTICDVVWEGRETAALAPLAKATRGYTEDVKRYDYNVEEAKKLLAEAGYPDGFNISISTNEASDRGKICEMLQAQWAEIGVNLEIKVFEVGAFTTHLRGMEHEIFVAAINNPLNDPDSPLYFSFCSEYTYGAGNFTAYNNPEIDKLLMDARAEQDVAKNTAIYEQVLKILVDDAAWLPITSPTVYVAARSNVKGFEMLATNYMNTYNNVYFE